MKSDSEQRIDALFDEAWEKGQTIPVPDSSESWERVRAMVDKRNRNIRLRRKYAMAAAMFVSLLAGAIIFGAPQVSRAFMPIFQSFKQIQGNVIDLFFSAGERNTEGARTPPPPDYDPSSVQDDVLIETLPSKMNLRTFNTLQEAEPYTDLIYKIPKDIPRDYKIENIFLAFEPNQKLSQRIEIHYTKNEEDKWLKLMIRRLEGPENYFTISGAKSSSHYEEFELNGRQAYYMVGQNQMSKLEWMDAGIHIILLSNLAKDELLDIALSIP